VPGITRQIQSTDGIIDYNPNIGYRFYGKFTAGAGWNERFSAGKHFKFHLKDRIYGARVFAARSSWISSVDHGSLTGDTSGKC
jgi:hypothetical protein